MLINEYIYRGFIIRHTKDDKGVDIIAVSKSLPNNKRTSIRSWLASLEEAEQVVDAEYEKKAARQRMREIKETKNRESAYRQKWQGIYDRDEQDLY